VLEKTAHRLVRVNYDIGNSAALGRTPLEELTLLTPWIGSVHVKDRILSGNSVPLGTGAADSPTCFRLLHAGGFRGQFILQAAREEGISEVELAIRNQKFVELQLATAANKRSELTNYKKCVYCEHDSSQLPPNKQTIK
jgi:hexulose-6-phosphate isomerase